MVEFVQSDCFPSLMKLGCGCIPPQLCAFAVCGVQILLVRDKDGFMEEENMASLLWKKKFCICFSSSLC